MRHEDNITFPQPPDAIENKELRVLNLSETDDDCFYQIDTTQPHVVSQVLDQSV
jgi:hypothetical protein